MPFESDLFAAPADIPVPQQQPAPPAFKSDLFSNPNSVYVADRARNGADWSEVSNELGPNGGVTKEQYKLEAARSRASQMDEPGWLEAVRKSIPGASAVGSYLLEREYKQASDRIAAGKAEDKDYDFVAQSERLRQLDEQRSRGLIGGLREAAVRAPAILGEAYATGGINVPARAAAGGLERFAIGQAVRTPLQPSLYAEQVARRATEQGGEPTDLKNVAVPLATAYLQNLVLGSAAKIGGGKVFEQSLPSTAGKLAGAGVAGVGEQGAIDIAGGLADEVVNENWKTKTRYGILGDLVRGEPGKASTQAAVQALTFTAFAGLHARKTELVPLTAEVLDAGAKTGLSKEAAARPIVEVIDQLKQAPTPEARQAVVESMPEKTPLRKLAENYRELMELKGEETRQRMGPGREMPAEAEPVAAPRADLEQAVSDDAIRAAARSSGLNAGPRAPVEKVLEQMRTVFGDEYLVGKGYLRPKQTESRAGREVAAEQPTESAPEARAATVPEPPTSEAKPEIAPESPQPSAEARVGQEPAAPEIVRQERTGAKEVAAAPLAGVYELAKDLPYSEFPGIRERLRSASLKELREAAAAWDLSRAGGWGKKKLANEMWKAALERKGSLERIVASGEVAGAKPDASAASVDLTERPYGDAKPAPAAAGKPKLTDQEQHVLAETLNGRSFRDIAGDAEMGGVSHETVRSRLKSAMEKQGFSKEDIAAELEAQRANSTVADHERGRAVPVGEMGAVEPVRKKARQRLDTHEKLSAEIEKLTNELLKEVKRGQELSPERRAAYDEAVARLRAEVEGRVYQATEPAAGAAAKPAPGAERPGPGPRAGRTNPIADATRRATGIPDGMSVEDAAAKMLADQMASRTLNQGPGTAAAANFNGSDGNPTTPREAGTRFVDSVHDTLKELGGAMVPRTTRLSEASGEAIVRYIAARNYARELTPVLIDKVIPEGKGEPFMLTVGGVLTEMRLRFMREAFLRAGDKEAAEKVQTIVGQPPERGGDVLRSPFLTEADFQAALRDPDVQAAIQRFKEHVVPIMDENYRAAEGLEADDPIQSNTQMPDLPVNLKPWHAGDAAGTGVVAFTSKAGSLRNPAARKLPFARQATGAAEGYDINIGSIIENSVMRSTELARQAEMYRQLEADGLARWGRTASAEEGYTHEIPRIDPPRGTQANKAGERGLFFNDNGVMQEVRKALDVDLPWKQVPYLSGILTRATLLSLGEVTAHTKNLLTMMFKPGMSLSNLYDNTRGVLRNDMATREAIVELARIGALKPKGFEAQMTGALGDTGLLSKFSPLTWSGKFLDVIDRAMRLTADQAFTQVAKRQGVVPSETARRDFVNQLGQYERRAQHWLIQFARDTGLGPFATAGSNFFAQGIKSLVGGHGFRTASGQADLRLRAEYLARMAAFIAVVPVYNYLRWDRVDGDDNTPLGAIKLGTRNGKTEYFDLAALTGITRGARAVGLQALAEGVRPGATKAGATSGDIIDRARKDIVSSVLHPIEGPVVSFAYTATTGEDLLGRKVAATPSTATTPAGKAKAEAAGKPAPGTSETMLNTEAALIHANPIVAAIMSLTGLDPAKKKVDVGEELWRLVGPYGVKSRAQPPGAPHRKSQLLGHR